MPNRHGNATTQPAVARRFAGVRVLLTDGFARQTLPMARALRKHGCHVVVLCSTRWDLGYVSRWPHQRLLGPDARQNPVAFVNHVEKLMQDHKINVVIPHNDCSAEALSKSKERLSRWGAIAVNDYPVLLQARDKLQTMTVCSEHQIPCPATLLDEVTCAAVLNSALRFPLAVKPRRGDSAVGFNRFDTQAEVETKLDPLAKRFGPLLVQEFIPQSDLQYKCELFIDGMGELKGAIVFSKIRWYPREGGSSTLNATVDRPDIIDTCVKLLRAIGWVGYGDVDLIQDPRDGVAKVMEINPRVTGSVKIAFDAGLDFAVMIAEQALGLPVTRQESYQRGRYLRHFHKDVLWFLVSPDRFRVKPNWFNFRDTTDQILSFSDPLPGLVYSLQSCARLLGYRKRCAGEP